MRGPGTAFASSLAATRDRGNAPRDFVWVVGKNRTTGALTGMGLWSGDETADFAVIDGQTGAIVQRTYFGAVNLRVGAIPRTSDLNQRSVAVRCSQISPAAQQIVRGLDARLARVEIHSVDLDLVSRLPVGPAEVEFLGVVNGAPIETPAAGAEGGIEMDVVSDAIAMLARTNFRKRSDETQKARSGDRFSRYGSVIRSWPVVWGGE
ncbi:MAG: hypothetical protein DI629_03410 [Mesorhizobium amorphae]|nr:MAG: hypothetical protein DI629_03410 [Mesorhizobium amorphae]